MRREANILILQDRSIGLESLQDDLRRVQLFVLFSYAADKVELHSHLNRRSPDAVLLVQRHFEMTFDAVLHVVRSVGQDIPLIVILQAGHEIEGMELVRRGAQDYLLETELQRLAPSIFLALRDHHVEPHTQTNGHHAGEPVTFELRTSNGRQPSAETLIDNMIDLVTELDITGNILYESPSITPLLGYSQEDLIGRNAFALIHALDVPRVMPVFMVALANPGIPHSARFRFKHKNGKWRTLEAVGKAIIEQSGGRRMVVTSRDITDRANGKAHRSGLGDSEARFMAVVEGLGEGLLITDTQDKILYANKRMGEMTGYEVTEILGKPSYKVFLPEQAWEIFMQQKEKWLLGNLEEYEISIARKDGSLLCAHVNISPYRNSEGHITGTLAAFLDITSRKQAEEEVQRAFEHLQAAKEHAEDMNRLKTSLLANVSHEIRTPLNSILGFSSVLIDSLEGSELVEFATTIENAGKRLYKTIEGILDLASVESNTVTLNPELVSLEEEVKKVTTLLQAQADEKRIELFVEAAKPVQMMVDVHYLGRILLNMIGNAIKFTELGMVRIVIENSDDDRARIKIIDTGIGIAEEFLPQLFREFQQESSGIARLHEGTGLGLTISKRLVEIMGGSISVESTKGIGSCFTVLLPIGLPEALRN